MTEMGKPKPGVSFPYDEIPRRRRHKAPLGDCMYCDRERAVKSKFHPPHDASPRCESGHHPHCTCDTCF